MTLNELARDVHQTAVEHGFWIGGRSFGEQIALIHSEASEALEADRAGEPLTWEPEDKPGKVNGAAGELVDVIIRCLDSLAFMDVDIDEIFKKKAEYNRSREFKNGKRY